MGAKAFEQCAGFLRIKDGENPLDDTGIHPENYATVQRIVKMENTALSALLHHPEKLQNITWERYTNEHVGIETLMDIQKELKHPGVDPRGQAESFQFTEGIRTIEDVRKGMRLNGIVTNLTKFGAFVDIGIKENGLIHISEMSNTFIKDPSEVLQLNQKVNVELIDVDVKQKRIALRLKPVK